MKPVPTAAASGSLYAAAGFLQQAGSRLEAAVGELQARVASQLRYRGDIAAAQKIIAALTAGSPDVVMRRIAVGATGWPALVAYVDGLASDQMVDQDTIAPLQAMAVPAEIALSGQALLEAAAERLIRVGQVSPVEAWPELMERLLSGATLVLIQDAPKALVLDTVSYPARSIPVTSTEPALKGPQEAFNEVGLTHLNQLRRWIRSPDLRIQKLTLGWRSHTPVYLAYLAGVANPRLLAAVQARLGRIRRAQVVRVNELVEYLYERRWSVFPQVRMTDRVDWVVQELGQGKIAVMVENDPFAAVLPVTFMDFYHTSQDYSTPFWDATLVRLIRLLSLFASLYLMPLYIALTSVNVDLMPTRLLLTIAGSRRGIPFPTIGEVLIMWSIIEILREAANRLPKELAVTLGTVGAVVVGTAIVKAGLVSDVMIIIATLTALGLFATPAYEMTTPWRWLFWAMILASYFFGVFGMLLVTVGIIAYLAALEPFGTPFLLPFGPLRVADLADSWVRLPFPWLLQRSSAGQPQGTSQAQAAAAPEDPLALRGSAGSR